jgi:hypothetical protein
MVAEEEEEEEEEEHCNCRRPTFSLHLLLHCSGLLLPFLTLVALQIRE